RSRRRGVRARLPSLACALPVLMGFLLPAGILVGLAASSPEARGEARLLALVGNSFTLAGVTAFAAVLLAVVLAYAARLSKSRVAAAVNRGAALGYAVPGAVIAVGVRVPLGRLDNWLAGALEDLTGAKAGLLFTGTIAALVYALLVRFLAVALQTTEAGLARITPSMEDAARNLGASPTGALARVHAALSAPESRRAIAGDRRRGPGAARGARAALLPGDAVVELLRGGLVAPEHRDVDRVLLERAQLRQHRVVDAHARHHRPLVVAVGEIALRLVARQILEELHRRVAVRRVLQHGGAGGVGGRA